MDLQQIEQGAFPGPPADKCGWPWNVPFRQGSDCGGPLITVVTPVYNGASFIEETIRSVLLQGYKNLEFIVIDGGSNDGTIDIIKKYERWLSDWSSEPDAGQADAINKGLGASKGELFQFLNADDVLLPGAVAAVAKQFGVGDALAGKVRNFGLGASEVYCNTNLTAQRLISDHGLRRSTFHQPGVWLRTERLREIGGFDIRFQYCFDFELMVRYLDKFPNVIEVEQELVAFRLHSESKSVKRGHEFGEEFVLARRSLLGKELSPSVRRRCEKILAAADWPARVEGVVNSRASRRAKLLELGSMVRSDPAVGLNRYTLGAVRRILASRHA